MSLVASSQGGGDYERLEGGGYAARCVHVIGLGTHLNTHPKAEPGSTKQEVLIVWETNEKMKDDRPFTVHKRYTISLGTKANLYQDLVSWRSKPFTEAELQGFELKNLLDVPAYLSVSKVDKGDKTYNNVVGILPLPKGMVLEDRYNPLIIFDPAELGTDEETYRKIWPWVRKIIKDSFEGKAFFAKNPHWGEDEEREPGSDDDKMPF